MCFLPNTTTNVYPVSENPTEMKANAFFESINPKTQRILEETIIDRFLMKFRRQKADGEGKLAEGGRS